MFCTACGVRNAESSNFCKQCGHKIDRVGASRISEEAYDRALPMEEQIDALLERAYRLRKSGELSAAVALCEEALHLNSDSTSVHSLLGQIHEQQGKREAAIHEYERVLQLNPGSIADRVKLDELRGDGLPTPLHPRSAPHIVVADRADRSLPNPNGRQMLGIAGVAGVFMLLGGLLTLQFHTRQEKSGVRPTGGISRNNAVSGGDAPQTDASPGVTSSTGAGVSSGTSAPAKIGTAIAVNSRDSGPTRSADTVAPPSANSSQPPIYIREPPPRVVYIERGTASAAPVRRKAVGLPNMGNGNTQPASDTGDERVRLSDSGGGQYIIPISPGSGTGDTASPDSGDKSAVSPKNAGASVGKGSGATSTAKNSGTRAFQDKITVHPNGNVHSDGSSSAITSDAQSRIVIAADKFRTGDYDSAIKAYRRALPGAGGQTAYVFQQMGICFQRIKDKASAIENFNSAIQEYQKLESANQQVDLARVGIRLCRNGIKLCKAE